MFVSLDVHLIDTFSIPFDECLLKHQSIYPLSQTFLRNVERIHPQRFDSSSRCSSTNKFTEKSRFNCSSRMNDLLLRLTFCVLANVMNVYEQGDQKTLKQRHSNLLLDWSVALVRPESLLTLKDVVLALFFHKFIIRRKRFILTSIVNQIFSCLCMKVVKPQIML